MPPSYDAGGFRSSLYYARLSKPRAEGPRLGLIGALWVQFTAKTRPNHDLRHDHEGHAERLSLKSLRISRNQDTKIPRGTVIDTTQFGTSTISLIFRSPATLQMA